MYRRAGQDSSFCRLSYEEWQMPPHQSYQPSKWKKQAVCLKILCKCLDTLFKDFVRTIKLRPSIILGKYGRPHDRPLRPKVHKNKKTRSLEPFFDNYYRGVKRTAESETYVPEILQFIPYHRIADKEMAFNETTECPPLYMVYHSHCGKLIHLPIVSKKIVIAVKLILLTLLTVESIQSCLVWMQ
uniref:Ovule protein n=1 Tax=Rhabditophanes sp. KR3021 TaxID=114890 RepID=A0AC35TQ25_9BILA